MASEFFMTNALNILFLVIGFATLIITLMSYISQRIDKQKKDDKEANRQLKIIIKFLMHKYYPLAFGNEKDKGWLKILKYAEVGKRLKKSKYNSDVYANGSRYNKQQDVNKAELYDERINKIPDENELFEKFFHQEFAAHFYGTLSEKEKKVFYFIAKKFVHDNTYYQGKLGGLSIEFDMRIDDYVYCRGPGPYDYGDKNADLKTIFERIPNNDTVKHIINGYFAPHNLAKINCISYKTIDKIYNAMYDGYREEFVQFLKQYDN